MFLSIKIGQTSYDIAYTYRKNGQAPVLVYVHGAGCSKKDFAAAYERAELQEYSLLSFDFPGCGDSPPYPKDVQLSIDDLADITHEVVSHLQISKAIIVGHSMGGAVSLRCIDKYPGLAVAFADVDGNLTAKESTFTKTIVSQPIAQFEAEGIHKLTRAFAAQSDYGSRAYAETLRRVSPRVLHDYSASLIAHSASGELLGIFLKLTIPRTYLYGDAYHDKVMARYADMFAQHDIELLEIPRSAHWPMHDNPEVFYRSLAAFVRKSIQDGVPTA